MVQQTNFEQGNPVSFDAQSQRFCSPVNAFAQTQTGLDTGSPTTPRVESGIIAPVADGSPYDLLSRSDALRFITNPGCDVLQGGVKLTVPTSPDGNLPGIGISQGTDVFLPDVDLSQLGQARDFRPPAVARQVGQIGDVTPPALPPQIGDLTPPAVAPQDRLTEIQAKIADAVQEANGTKPWVGSRYQPNVQNGRLAGAASVSVVLQNLGHRYADSANVGTLSSQLQRAGWTAVPLNQARPGDIVFGGKVGKDWRAGGGNAHIGIIGPDGKLMHNDSATGNWKGDTIADSFPEGQYGNQIWVLRAPPTIPDRIEPDRPRPNRPPRPDGPSPYRPRPDITPDVRPDDRPDDRPPQPGERNGNILDAAKRSVDRRLWASSPFANMVKGGRLGCAASVSEVLKMAGFGYANSAGVGGLVDQLKNRGWTRVPISEARPGDVVYGGKPGTRWWEGGGNAHIGVVGEGGKVYHNSSGARRWVQDNLTSVFNTNRFGNQRYALRPPQNA